MYTLTLSEIDALARELADQIAITWHTRAPLNAYAVPRGGVPAALALQKYMDMVFVETPEDADIIIDDVVDSGRTKDALAPLTKRGPDAPCFYALIDKTILPKEHKYQDWLVFPWEGDALGSMADNVVRILQYIGEDVTRGGLIETPARVTKAWAEWSSGYGVDPASVLKTFEDGAEGADEMVIVKGIPFYSHCEHHMAAFFGTVTIAYLPNKKIVGLSKLSRLVEIYAKRLQVQERLGTQIANALMLNLEALGCGVIINARHLCMESRGVQKQGSTTTTSALRGLFKTDDAVRAEFMSLARN